MEIKTKKHFNEIIKSLTEELLDEEDLDETTGTGSVAGYNTPFAFKKKKKKVDEALETKDLDKITKLIRAVVGNIIRDIWLKRSAWNK